MFEQSILVQTPTKTGWGVLLSITLQALCVSILVVLPLVFTDHMSAFQWSNILVAPWPPAPRIEPAPVQIMAARPMTRMAVAADFLVAPSRIPDRVTMIVDPTPLPGAGVPGSTGPAGAVTGLLGDIIRIATPPPVEPPATGAMPAPAKPLAVSGGVQAAKLIRKVIPVYPVLARQARISGTVRLVGIIGRDGTIQNLQLISGPPLLVDAALQAVRQWVYQPTLLNGQPVEVIAPIDVIFKLSQ